MALYEDLRRHSSDVAFIVWIAIAMVCLIVLSLYAPGIDTEVHSIFASP